MTDISHYGVPGMKWGVRKSEAELAKEQKRRESYTSKQRSKDRAEVGKRGVKRIENRVAKGKTLTKARRAEAGRKMVTEMLMGATAAVVLNPVTLGAAAVAGDQLLRKRVGKQNAKFAAAGAKRAADILSDKRGLTTLNTISLNTSQYSSKIL